jgi:hypothetical protein
MKNQNITHTKAFTFFTLLCSFSGGIHAKAPSQVKNYEDYLVPNSIFQGKERDDRGSDDHIYENDRGSDDHIYENDRGSDDHIYAEITHLDADEDDYLVPNSIFQGKERDDRGSDDHIYAEILDPRDLQRPTKAKSSNKEKLRKTLQRAKSFNFGSLRSFVKDTVSSITEKKRSGSLPNLTSNDEGSKFSRTFFSQGKLQRSKSFDLGSLRSFVKDTVSSITEKKRSGSLPNLSGKNSLDAVVQEKISNAVKRLKNSDEKNFEEAFQEEIRQYKKALHKAAFHFSIQTNEKQAAQAALVWEKILEYDAQVESFKKGLREAIDSQNNNQEQVTEL